MVKTLPSITGNVDLIPGQGTKIPHAAEPLSLRVSTRKKPATKSSKY